jgi:predicted TIM-barrel fold metal-dependent hydrolase
VLIHNDIDIPFAKEGAEPAYLNQLKALFKRHSNVTIIWAHMGLGRTVRPGNNHVAEIEGILSDPDFHHVYFDISWDEAAKYVVASPQTAKTMADLMQRFPDRFLFGTDGAAPRDQSQYMKVFYQYEPLWKLLGPETLRKVRLQNYERIFNEARRKVRGWENAHSAR